MTAALTMRVEQVEVHGGGGVAFRQWCWVELRLRALVSHCEKKKKSCQLVATTPAASSMTHACGRYAGRAE